MTTFKINRFLILVFLLMPVAAVAQEREYDETNMILRDINSTGVVGAMTSNIFVGTRGIEGYNGGGLITLRLFAPRDMEREAVVEALKGLLGG